MTPQRPVEGSRSAQDDAQEHADVRSVTKPSEARSGTRISVIDIPAPCKYLNSNNRLHRMEAAKLTKAWRKAGQKAAEHTMRFEGQVHITAYIIKDSKRRYDVLNLWPSLKAAIDGIVSAGVLADDDWKHVVGPDMRHGGFGEPRIIINIEQL